VAQEPKSTTPTLCIVESLGFLEEDTHREGEIISRTLRLSGKTTHYSYLRSCEELKAFVKEFGDSKHRYLHIACHGNPASFFTTTGNISAVTFANLLAPHACKRRIFLSSCQAARSNFARKLLERQPGCYSILAPVGNIYFDDAAIFWTAFYHLIFKENYDSMNRSTIESTVEQCAKLVEQKFRLFYNDHQGKFTATTLG